MNAVADKKYRVVLTGQLRQGADRQRVVREMAELFNAPATLLGELLDGSSHPIDQAFSADEALEMQHALEGIGVLSRVERLSTHKLDLRLRPPRPEADADPAVAPGMMRCPACGHHQAVAARCTACGVDFEEFNHRRRVPPPQASVARPPTRAATPASERWKPSRDDLVDDVQSEELELRLFIGRRARRYLRVFERFGSSSRPHFALSWNWGTLVSPLLWTLHRKLWPWAVLALVTEVIAPMTVLVLSSRGVLPPPLILVAGTLAVLNRTIWPAVADYLYFRQAHSAIRRLHRMSPTRAHELEIAAAGGSSGVAVFFGAVCAGVLTLLLWSAVDTGRLARYQYVEVADTAPSATPATPATPATSAAPQAQTPQAALPPAVPKATPTPPPAPTQSKWVITRSGLRSLGAKVDAWLEGAPPGTDPTQLTMTRLRVDVGVTEAELQDGWGTAVHYIPAKDGFQFVSAGPDQLFGTIDDIAFRQVVKH